MITITTSAAQKLSAYLSENNIKSPVRIATMNSCSGPSLGLALDKRKEADYVQENGDVTLLIDPDLARICGEVTVDFVERSSGCGCGGGGEFSLTSEKPLPSAGSGSCSCSSSSCGR